MNTVLAPIGLGAPPDPAALPGEWAAWAEEPGRSVRIEEDGVLLGAVHAIMVGRAEAWIEGLWVRPPARGRGVARRLLAEAEMLVRGHGAMVVRGAVPAHDDAALAVAERMGFVHRGEAVALASDIADPPAEEAGRVVVVAAATNETAAVTRALGAGAPVDAWRGLVPLGWRFRRLVPELVRGLIKDVRVLRSGDGPDGVALFGVGDQDAVIAALAGPPAHRRALFGEVIEQARGAGASRVVLFTPARDDADGLGVAFTPHPWCPEGLVIVEKTLDA
jgi:ribosomal protein S18 acetylase RimI-like enzyme